MYNPVRSIPIDAVAPATPSSSDAARWWFTTLDERPFSAGTDRWLTNVVGIHHDGPDLWIQLEAFGEQLRTFILRVTPGMTLDDAAARIERLWRDAVPDWKFDIACECRGS